MGFKSNKVETIMNRLSVAVPQPRDTKTRPAFIPEAALKKRKEKMERKLAEDEEEMETSVQRKTERQIELELGDDYIVDLKKNYDLPDDQKYDVIPETWQGHNIADFIDPDIMEKLEALEKEEEARERAGYYDSDESEEDESYAEIKDLATKIRHKKAIMKADQFLDNTRKPTLNRKSVAKKSLFDSIKPLFANKPLIVVANKMDVVKRSELSDEKRAILEAIEAENKQDIMEMSTVTEEGVIEVKTKACEELLQDRVNHKFKSNKVETIMNRLSVAVPQPRDTKTRPAFIPEAALKKRREKMERKLAEDEEEMETSVQRKTERQIELELGDDYIVDLKKNYDLPDDQKYDVIPETWQGHNIADFIDPDIMEKLEALEKEEEARERAGYYDSDESEEDESYA